MKYIVVTGGVISGVGKGIVASSFGILLQSRGLHVTSIKIDPYLNIDAGTLSPYEHGEVFVLNDGGEVDLDLGNYERFMDVTLTKDNNITTGKIYRQVIDNERSGKYLGKSVQVVPHITHAIQEWITRVAHTPVDNGHVPDVCIIEVGGTIGETEGIHFLEALTELKYLVTSENICFIHVCLVPQSNVGGEPKTKPTQSSVRELRRFGIWPDIIVCRSCIPLADSLKEKISSFCYVNLQQIYCVHDVACIYRVPLILREQGADDYLVQRLSLATPTTEGKQLAVSLDRWTHLANRCERQQQDKVVTITLVGKYTEMKDAYMSVIQALEDAALAVDHRLNLQYIDAASLATAGQDDPEKYQEAMKTLSLSSGVLVPGGFDSRGIEGKIRACQVARENKIPFLGICLGLQCAVIEFCRHVLGWETANSTEWDSNTRNPVVVEMPEHNVEEKGGTMRLGLRRTCFTHQNSIIRQLYHNVDAIEERQRHRYEVNPDVVSALTERGMQFVGRSEDGRRMEIMELDDHPYYVGVQFHPEYTSRPLRPSPPFLGLLKAACTRQASATNQADTAAESSIEIQTSFMNQADTTAEESSIEIQTSSMNQADTAAEESSIEIQASPMNQADTAAEESRIEIQTSSMNQADTAAESSIEIQASSMNQADTAAEESSIEIQASPMNQVDTAAEESRIEIQTSSMNQADTAAESSIEIQASATNQADAAAKESGIEIQTMNQADTAGESSIEIQALSMNQADTAAEESSIELQGADKGKI